MNVTEQNSFNDIASMKINVIFKFNSNKSSLAVTSLERMHQPEQLQI